MKSKQEILAELQENLRTGIVTESDIRSIIGVQPSDPTPPSVTQPKANPDRLSAVDVMFYIAGIVLFSTVMSMIVQSWSDSDPLLHILLSAGIGLGLWSTAYYLIGSPAQSDIRKGLTNALLLTGSLLLVAGGYIVSNEIVGGFDDVNFMPISLALAMLAALHIGFDRLIKRNLVLLMGVFLAVSSFAAFMFGLLSDTNAPPDVWAIITIISCGLLVYAARVLAKLYPSRPKIRTSFDSFAALVALASMYIASYGTYGVLWLCSLIAAVFGIFYLSIILQNKHLLGNGSFFIVLTIITISFKYFSGFGVTFSLIVATAGLLGSAAVASSINKNYFSKTI
jgi:hypothetical protein